MDERWMDELRALDGALQSSPQVMTQVTERLRTRRRRRAMLGTTGVACLIGGLVAAVSLSSGAANDRRQPIAGQSPTTEPTNALVTCPTSATQPFKPYGDPPPISDVNEQENLVREITAVAWKVGSVEHAEPSHLGVVALVNGDVQEMKRILQRRGVSHVFRWDPTMKDAGVDGHGQIEQALQWVIGPAVSYLQKLAHGEGQAGVGYWQDAGAAVLRWKVPIPAKIKALAGTRPDGVRVIIDPVPYSSRDILRAGNAARQAGGRLGVHVQTTHECPDGSGLIVGIAPESLGNRTAELEQKLTNAVGMPVKVTAEEVFRGLIRPITR